MFMCAFYFSCGWVGNSPVAGDSEKSLHDNLFITFAVHTHIHGSIGKYSDMQLHAVAVLKIVAAATAE